MGLRALERSSFKLLILVFIVGTIFSCARAEENIDTTDPTIGNVLRLDFPVPFTFLDPTREESGSIYVFHFLYDELFSMSEHGEFIPELAASFDYDPLELTWKIHLKEGPRFHNGKPVKASDVAYSLRERLRNLRPQYYQSIERIVPQTDESVHIVLKKDDPEFLLKIFEVKVVAEPAAGSDDYYNHPIGSGPFIFEYRKGETEVGLVANEHYHKGRPYLDRVTLYFEPNSEKSWARLINGSTDAAFQIDPVDNGMLTNHKDMFRLNATAHPFYAILLYNTYDPLFSSSKVRMALSLAIDKEAIVKEVLKGYGRVASGPLELDSPGQDRSLKPVPYDPQEGIKILGQEGWTCDDKGRYLKKHGTPFEFTILYAEKNRMMKGVAEYL